MLSRRLSLVLSVLAVIAVSVSSSADTITLDLGAGVKLELIRIPAGKFRQGSPPSEVGRGGDETEREVTISRDFYLGKHEVTRGQYARFVAENGYRTEAEKGSSGGFGFDGQGLVQRKEFTWRNPGFPQTDDHPVVLVTYDDALAFVQWLSRRVGRTVTLPTEAEWEYAARAGSQSRFPGVGSDEEARTIAWFKANTGNGTRPVGQLRPNAFGIHDMSGNAYEWCRDWYAPYAPGPVSDPLETRSTLSEKPRRVLRGGSWLKDLKACRAAARYRNTPGSRNADNGFRIAALLEPVTAASAPDAVGREAATTRRAAPTRVGVSGGGSDSYAGMAAVLGMMIAIGGFLFYMLRRLTRGLGVGFLRKRMRLADDGFYLSLPDVPVGTRIRYRTVVDGVTRTGEVLFAPGLGEKEHFVYTGGRPEGLHVTIAPLVADGAATPESASFGERHDHEEPAEPSRPFRGHPSAY